MQKNWWIWLAFPAAATTALLAAITVMTREDEEPVRRTIATSVPKQEVVATNREREEAATVTPPPTPAPVRTTTAREARKPVRAAGLVPNVYGLTAEEAIAELEQAGFRAKVRRERSFQPDGLVFDQRPRTGLRLPRGKTVLLTVSIFPSRAPAPRRPPAPPVSPVPRLVGLDYWEAAARMELLGVVANLYPSRSNRSFGTVVRQEPASGTRVPRGSRVRLDVSLGNYPLRSVRVPDTVGLSEQMAHSRCRDAYLTCRTVLVAAPEPSAAGRVVRQSPPSGQVDQALTQMTLFVGE
jgi:eukaryotic-like serine/threonine-protein kinase